MPSDSETLTESDRRRAEKLLSAFVVVAAVCLFSGVYLAFEGSLLWGILLGAVGLILCVLVAVRGRRLGLGGRGRS